MPTSSFRSGSSGIRQQSSLPLISTKKMVSPVMCLILTGLETQSATETSNNSPTNDLPSVWWNPVPSSSPEDKFVIYQSDILLPSDPNSRNAIKDKMFLWKNRTIPYKFGDNFTSTEESIIRDAMAELEEKSCIRFVENNEGLETYISFRNKKNGCYAPIGRLSGNEGPLPVNLQSPECFREKGIAVHELLHVAGLFHEQSRTDRDDFVIIHWCNILPNKEHNFAKANDKQVDDYGVPYDFASIMHYSRLAFSRNGKPTITAKSDPDMELGQRKEPTENDMKKINRMYECTEDFD